MTKAKSGYSKLKQIEGLQKFNLDVTPISEKTEANHLLINKKEKLAISKATNP